MQLSNFEIRGKERYEINLSMLEHEINLIKMFKKIANIFVFLSSCHGNLKFITIICMNMFFLRMRFIMPKVLSRHDEHKNICTAIKLASEKK